MKYKEWLHDWLELYEKESVKPRTYKQYEDVINPHTNKLQVKAA